MLLSIDRVLQLLIEGKSIDKISEQAHCSEDEVINILSDAKNLLLKYEKPVTRKKIILKKNKNKDSDKDQEIDSILFGAELSAVPYESSLIFYVHGKSTGKPGPAGMGIVIIDKDQHQVGKVSLSISRATSNECLIKAITRSIELAARFNPTAVKIRFSDEFILQLLLNERTTENKYMIKLIDDYSNAMKKITNLTLELIPIHQNDKASYLAEKAIQEI